MSVGYDPNRHHRRSIRMNGYDYRQAGGYFLTICTHDRACLFGEVADGTMRLNDAGHAVEAIWHDLPSRYPALRTDAFVVMPNHVHGIIVLGGQSDSGGARSVGPGAPTTGATTRVAPTTESVGAPLVGARGPGGSGGLGDARSDRPGAATAGATTPRATTPRATTPRATTRVAPTVGDIVGAFKSITTNEYARGVHTSGWPPSPGRLWQRNYYEHVIRDDADLDRIRQYIDDNPARWAEDPDNPQSVGLAPRGDTGQPTR
jgi:putative transposase